MLLEGIARTKGSRPARQATAAGPDVLRRMLATRLKPKTPLGARDRALLLLGFAEALRRSELVGLALGDVEVVPQRGLHLLIRRSKTDQRGAGQAVALWANPKEPALCPARALEPPALPPELATGPGIITLSTSLLGDHQVPAVPSRQRRCRPCIPHSGLCYPRPRRRHPLDLPFRR